jgi:hypothetical protein
MGYTHYFPQTRSFTDEEWKEVKKAFCSIKLLCEARGISLIDEGNKEEDEIRFNGEGELIANAPERASDRPEGSA